MGVPAAIAGRIEFDRYTWWVGHGMERAYRRATRTPSITHPPVQIDELKAVVFSDHHRGVGDSADDFRRCEQAYAAALGWYLEQGYELWLLGDVEELWANRVDDVMARYGHVLELERRFGARLTRFYGNHDLAWRSPALVHEHLPGLRVHEAMRVPVCDGDEPLGELFLAHGHQGTIDSGNLLMVPVARLAVRLWTRLQRWHGFANQSPLEDDRLRHRHDTAMARWADTHRERLILVAAHTHHPVFLNTDPPDLARDVRRRDAELEAARATGVGIPAARAAREAAAIRELRDELYEPPDLYRWSYFNGGCCSFADGDITGLEFAGGEARLVRWSGNTEHPEPAVLQRRPLRDVFATLTGAPPRRRLKRPAVPGSAARRGLRRS